MAEPKPNPQTIRIFERDQDQNTKPTPPKHQNLRDILSVAGILVSAVVLAFCLITFVFQSYQVSGPSMQTTLQNGDHLIIWKVGKTFASLTHRDYIPGRGDVIVFHAPNRIDASHPEGEQLIKRVIALPGERVTVKKGYVTVYNKEHPEGFQPDKTLPYGKVIPTTPGDIDLTLGKSQIFVCGDNRNNSIDSRASEVGPVDSKYIVGKLIVRVLPLNSAKRF